MEFVVDKVEYSPKDFYDQFSKFLPRLVQVTKGYYGEEQIKTYERGQVLFIRRSGRQERAVASVLKGPLPLTRRLLSIPLDYNAHFSFSSAKKGNKKYSLRQVLSKRSLPVDVIFMPEMASPDSESSPTMRLINNDDNLVLRLTHKYQDTFLLGHNLLEDKVTSAIQQIPLFLTDLRMSLVVGRKGYEQQGWNNYIQSLTEICDNQIQCDHLGNPDIALYAKEDGDFDATVQVPQVYCTLHDCLTETNVYQTISGSKPKPEAASYSEDESCNTYEVIANLTREQTRSSNCPAENKPKVPPKPPIKSKSMYHSRTVASAKDTNPDKPPGIPRRGNSVTGTVKVKGHKSLFKKRDKDKVGTNSDLSKCEYEDICVTSGNDAAFARGPESDRDLSSDSTGHNEKGPQLPRRNESPRGKKIRKEIEPPSTKDVKKDAPSSTKDVKKDVLAMSIQDVGDLLQKLKLEKYTSVFQEQWIDGAILSELTADILHSDCGMKKLEAVRLMTYVEKGHIPS